MEIKKQLEHKGGTLYSYTKIGRKYDLLKFLNLEAKKMINFQLTKQFSLRKNESLKFHVDLEIRFKRIESLAPTGNPLASSTGGTGRGKKMKLRKAENTKFELPGSIRS